MENDDATLIILSTSKPGPAENKRTHSEMIDYSRDDIVNGSTDDPSLLQINSLPINSTQNQNIFQWKYIFLRATSKFLHFFRNKLQDKRDEEALLGELAPQEDTNSLNEDIPPPPPDFNKTVKPTPHLTIFKNIFLFTLILTASLSLLKNTKNRTRIQQLTLQVQSLQEQLKKLNPTDNGSAPTEEIILRKGTILYSEEIQSQQILTLEKDWPGLNATKKNDLTSVELVFWVVHIYNSKRWSTIVNNSAILKKGLTLRSKNLANNETKIAELESDIIGEIITTQQGLDNPNDTWLKVRIKITYKISNESYPEDNNVPIKQ